MTKIPRFDRRQWKHGKRPVLCAGLTIPELITIQRALIGASLALHRIANPRSTLVRVVGNAETKITAAIKQRAPQQVRRWHRVLNPAYAPLPVDG